MLIKEQAPAVVPALPNSFTGLMDLYETNYMQLKLLLGSIQALPDQQLARVAERLPVRLEVRERSAHTTTLFMTYVFSSYTEAVQETRPDLLVRIYHDALQAEVIHHRCRFDERMRHNQPLALDNMLSCRWRMNRFLFKWISYLRRQGYVFQEKD
ncbi:DUF1249 domain-containing protein [Thiothrix eikelboomii]|uniref:DUF1249 domain-containing protein n=1 Tax=Thiothrix eikelboomii TaxID=92487 RepID=UPI003BAF052D